MIRPRLSSDEFLKIADCIIRAAFDSDCSPDLMECVHLLVWGQKIFDWEMAKRFDDYDSQSSEFDTRTVERVRTTRCVRQGTYLCGPNDRWQ